MAAHAGPAEDFGHTEALGELHARRLMVLEKLRIGEAVSELDMNELSCLTLVLETLAMGVEHRDMMPGLLESLYRVSLSLHITASDRVNDGGIIRASV